VTSPSTTLPAVIDCESTVRRLWDYLDAELDVTRAAEVEAHLARCLECPPHFVFAREMLEAVAASRRAPDEVSSLRARVYAALRASGFRETAP
jgi:anti-sigma factor RsiW